MRRFAGPGERGCTSGRELPSSAHNLDMAIRKIAQLGEPVLRLDARELTREELSQPAIQTLIDDMIETMRDADGAGLAAPQVYESLAIAVIEVQKSARYPNAAEIPLTVLVNPRLTPVVASGPDALADHDAIEVYEGCIEVYEGCLSVNGMRGRVRRPRRVHVEAWDRNGNALDFVWEGFHAAVVQHECDHLLGTLFLDRADPKTLTFLREYERHVPFERRIVDHGATP
jgi:peptide deformylase